MTIDLDAPEFTLEEVVGWKNLYELYEEAHLQDWHSHYLMREQDITIFYPI